MAPWHVRVPVGARYRYFFGDGSHSKVDFQTRYLKRCSKRCLRYGYDQVPSSAGGKFDDSSIASMSTTRAEVQFTSKERDSETGLDFFESRYYSSAQGRFTSPDEFKGGFLDAFSGQAAFQPGPLPYADMTDPQTLNKYAYVRNNPLRYTDPDGHCAEVLSCTIELGSAGSVFGPVGTVVGGLIGAGVGAVLGYEIGTHLFPSTPAPAQTPPSTSTDLTTATPGTPAEAPTGIQGPIQASGTKSAEQMAADLSKQLGKNTVTYETPSVKGHIDLAGRTHFDKATQTNIPTPHVQERPKSVGPNGKVNLGKETTRPATKQDIRTARRLEKEKNP
jgi:RHS repeat-associated protein